MKGRGAAALLGFRRQHVFAWRSRSDDVRKRALAEAARRGGTHILIAGEDSSTEWAQVTRDRATTTYYGNTAQTTYTPGAQVPITFHSGAFVVIRVPPSRWRELPPALQPLPGRDLSSWPPEATAAPDRAATTAAPATSHEWYCALELGAAGWDDCFDDQASCDTFRDDQRAKGAGMAACRAVTQVVCYTVTGTSPFSMCYSTLENCDASRDYMRTDPAAGLVATAGCQSTN